MIVRREQPADIDAIRDVVAAAFRDPPFRDPLPPDRTPAEAGLVDRLRADPGWLPGLSLVAVEPTGGGKPGWDGLDPGTGRVIGHVLCTRGWIGSAPALALGPVAVRPDRQGRGVGNALMHAVLAAAEALDESVVVLLGDPAYYGRFGFVLANTVGITPPQPQWDEWFQIRRLTTGPVPTGRFRHASPFDDL